MKILINTCFGGFGIRDEWEAVLYTLMPQYFERYEITEEHSWSTDKIGDVKFYCSGNKDIEFRSHPELIKLFEAEGAAIQGEHSKLAIREVPDEYAGRIHIEEYDGQEWIAEDHKTW